MQDGDERCDIAEGDRCVAIAICFGLEIEKVILKRAFGDQLPRSVIDRPKSGMRVPVHFWFQGELKKYARHILRPAAIKRAGIFDHRRVKQLLDYNIEEGSGRYGIRLWMLLTFEIWRRIVIERESV